MNTLGIGILIIGLATYLSVAGALAFRRLGEKSHTNYDQFHSMADPMLNVVATLFSILLGFLVAGAMERYTDTQAQCETEALKLADIFALARGMDDEHRIPLQKSCSDYCYAVINDEWPRMAKGQTSPAVWKATTKIWDAALTYDPDGDRQTDIHQSLIDAVRDLGESRRSRIVAMRQRLSPALWIVVIGGSIILMACTYMFFIENPKLQALMIALVALSLALNVFLLAIYSSPFQGDLKILPEAFDLDTQTFLHEGPPLVFPAADDSADDDTGKNNGKGKNKHKHKEKDSSAGENKNHSSARDKDNEPPELKNKTGAVPE